MLKDERGFIFGLTIPIIIIGIVGLFLFGAAAAINWHFIIAVIAFISVPIAFIGVVFFKADNKIITYSIVGAIALVLLIEVNIYNMLGLILIAGTMYYFKLLVPNRISMFVALLGVGGLFLILGYTYILIPLGVVP